MFQFKKNPYTKHPAFGYITSDEKARLERNDEGPKAREDLIRFIASKQKERKRQAQKH